MSAAPRVARRRAGFAAPAALRARRPVLAFVAAAAALLAGCAAPALTPDTTAELSYQSLGPGMHLGEQLYTVWVPAAEPAAGAAGSGPPAPLPDEDAPMVVSLAQLFARGADEPVNVGIGGPDSARTALVVRLALGRVQGELPALRIAFVGRQAELDALARIALLKRIELHFEPASR